MSNRILLRKLRRGRYPFVINVSTVRTRPISARFRMSAMGSFAALRDRQKSANSRHSLKKVHLLVAVFRECNGMHRCSSAQKQLGINSPLFFDDRRPYCHKLCLQLGLHRTRSSTKTATLPSRADLLFATSILFSSSAVVGRVS